MRLLLAALLALGFAGAVQAQNSVLVSLDSDELSLLNGNGLVEAGLMRSDEIGIVTPGPGAYSLGVFLGMSSQWAYLGDADNDGRYADDSVDSPGDEVDAILVKNFTPLGAPYTPRDVFFSKVTSGDGFAPTVEDGDVIRFAGPTGALEFFITESQLLDVIGQLTTADLELDAIAQSSTGELFVSFADAELVGGVSAADGALIYIPASSLTYNGQGNVTAVVTNTAKIVAEEIHFQAMVAASGMRTSVGGLPGTGVNELTALELDPAGGTWISPIDATITMPNLIFAWAGFSNDGALISTASGGTIPSINGIPMASTVATTGTQIGATPSSTGIFGVDGLGIIPQQTHPFVAENYPRNLITSMPSWHRVEFTAATPNNTVIVVADAGPSVPGLAVPSFILPPFGEFFVGGTAVNLGSVPSDADGFADFTTIFNLPVLTGANIVIQGIDVGTLTLSAPAALQFL